MKTQTKGREFCCCECQGKGWQRRAGEAGPAAVAWSTVYADVKRVASPCVQALHREKSMQGSMEDRRGTKGMGKWGEERWMMENGVRKGEKERNRRCFTEAHDSTFILKLDFGTGLNPLVFIFCHQNNAIAHVT
ncbi:hypothetical protein J6590_000072 [Homalodisca vitripennis]|nr:hypothetical protein J6590_000072 [Homalodisca vitripennis]